MNLKTQICSWIEKKEREGEIDEMNSGAIEESDSGRCMFVSIQLLNCLIIRQVGQEKVVIPI